MSWRRRKCFFVLWHSLKKEQASTQKHMLDVSRRPTKQQVGQRQLTFASFYSSITLRTKGGGLSFFTFSFFVLFSFFVCSFIGGLCLSWWRALVSFLPGVSTFVTFPLLLELGLDKRKGRDTISIDVVGLGNFGSLTKIILPLIDCQYFKS